MYTPDHYYRSSEAVGSHTHMNPAKISSTQTHLFCYVYIMLMYIINEMLMYNIAICSNFRHLQFCWLDKWAIIMSR